MWELYYYFSIKKYRVEPCQMNNFPYFSLWKALSIPRLSSTMKIKRKQYGTSLMREWNVP